MTEQNVALIAGVTGIVGEALVNLLSKPGTPGGPWKVYGLARSPRPNWMAKDVVYVQGDLLNRESTLEKLSPLSDVTHIFWVTWVGRSTEAENVIHNGQMMRNVLDAIVPNAKDLKHIALQTGAKHYLGSFESLMGGVKELQPNPFTEDLPRLPGDNFYYTLEDIVFETVKEKQGKVTWSVHRPGAIVGVAAGNAMNLVGTLAVYAAICKHEGLPFEFPGGQFNWETLLDASSGDLIAEQEVWSATDPRGQNQAFNTMNGDIFKWKNVWKPFADKMGLESVPFEGKPMPLSEKMKDKGPVWDKIVEENGLVPTKLEAVGHWWFADIYLNSTVGNVLQSMNKSKEHGFFCFRDTQKSILSCIDQMRERKIIPY